MTFHIQCKMSHGSKHYTAWLPEEYAVVGKIVDIDGVGSYRIDETFMKRDSVEIKEANDRLHRGMFASI